jgi:hypothetical protein
LTVSLSVFNDELAQIVARQKQSGLGDLIYGRDAMGRNITLPIFAFLGDVQLVFGQVGINP